MKWGKISLLLLIILIFFVYCHFEKRVVLCEPMTSSDIFHSNLFHSMETILC